MLRQNNIVNNKSNVQYECLRLKIFRSHTKRRVTAARSRDITHRIQTAQCEK